MKNKTFLLLRHAKSSWKNSSLRDHDRPLNKRGKEAAPRIGSLIGEQNLIPDFILSSTALRARTTAETVASTCRYNGPIQFDTELYLATAEELLRCAQIKPAPRHNRVMLVAHNPGLKDLVSSFVGKCIDFPTGALAVFKANINEWPELNCGSSVELVNIFLPRELEQDSRSH